MTSFWCSKCKVRHPGDCPPPVNLRIRALGGTLFTVDPWLVKAREWVASKCPIDISEEATDDLRLYIVSTSSTPKFTP